MFKKLQFIVFFIIVFAASIYIFSCSDSEVTNPPVTADTNVVTYNNVTIAYGRDSIFSNSYQCINLQYGTLELGASSFKDAIFDDSINTYRNFYLTSGDEMLDMQGSETWFTKLYSSLDSTRFDTLKTLDVGATLDSLDFYWKNTYEGSGYGYFVPNQTATPVYSFYLKGKYASGITKNRVYGVFRVKKIVEVFSPDAVLITLDIKLNKAGLNSFHK